MASLSIYNAHEGSTTLVQYIGSANDVCVLTPLILLTESTSLRDIIGNLLRSSPIQAVKDLGFDALLADVPAAQTLTQFANVNGVANWILWTQGVEAGLTLFAQVTVTQEN